MKNIKYLLLIVLSLFLTGCEFSPCFDCREVITTHSNGDIEIKEVCIEVDCQTI